QRPDGENAFQPPAPFLVGFRHWPHSEAFAQDRCHYTLLCMWLRAAWRPPLLVSRRRNPASLSQTGSGIPCASIRGYGAGCAPDPLRGRPGRRSMSTAAASKITPPAQGARISIRDGKLLVPDNPVIPFIEGDGTGPDIWRASVRVMDAAVQKAYGGKRKIHWMEVLAGEKANRQLNTWLPDETVAACREYLVSIKGPLTTPVGGGIRSLNVALRQMLDLYVCLRPVRWFKGVPSPVKHPERVDMV